MAKQTTKQETQETSGNGLTELALKLAKAGVVAEDFDKNPSPEARANRMRRMLEKRRKGEMLTPEGLKARAEEHRQRQVEERARQTEERKTAVERAQEETKALVSVLTEDEDGLEVILNDLKVRSVLANKPNRSSEEEAALKTVRQSLADVDFDNWHAGERALLLNGMPDAQSPDLRQGLTAWLKEEDAKRRAEYMARRDADNTRRQELLEMATATLHEAYADRDASEHKVLVSGSYPAMRYDQAANNGKGGMVAITRDGQPITRTGTFLLTVTDGGRYGQILDESVNMPMLREVPHPTNPVHLNPGKDFKTDRGEPFFHTVVAAMLAAQWDQEELEAVDTTVYDLLAGTDGRAMGETYFSSRDRTGNVKIWWQRAGDRLFIIKSECRPSRNPYDRNKKPFDFSGFPSDGIPVEPTEGEPGFIKLVRAILQKMAERHRTLDKYEAMKASDTAESMPEALETGKAVKSVFFENWREGDRDTGYKSGPVALQVENTGRGNMRPVGFFSTEETFDVPASTRVPVTLDLEKGDEYQMRFQKMLKARTPRTAESSKATEEEAGDSPAESSNTDVEAVAVESDA